MSDTTIQAFKNGPYIVQGSITILDIDGNAYDTSDQKMIALCRCGESENRPFCDGKHKSHGFISEDRAEPK